ncbi:unnamed protein product [Brassica oleracea]
MGTQVGKKFAWVIKNFSSLKCEICYSAPVLIGDRKWRLYAYPKGDNCDYLSLYLDVVDWKSLPSGWRRFVKLRLSVAKQACDIDLVMKDTRPFSLFFYTGFYNDDPFSQSDALEDLSHTVANHVVSCNGETEVSSGGSAPKEDVDDEALSLASNGNSCVFLKETSTINESMDVNGFNVLPSQVESVRRLFERHPDIAVRFRAKNQLLRNSCMNSLLSLIETLCKPLEDLSNEDLIGAEIALTYVKDSGFSVDWLEKKLDQVKEMKEKEVSGLAILQVTEEKLLKLKQKCAELEALAEEQKAESSATITPLSFYDVV